MNQKQEGTLLAAVGYLPLLFFLPLVGGKSDPYARFHGRQSMVMFIALVLFQMLVWISDFFLGRILGATILLGFLFRFAAWLIHYPLGFVVSGLYLLLVVYGMIQAASGRYWRIPVLGVYAERLGPCSQTG